MTTESTTQNKCDVSKLKVGDKLSRISYMEIVRKDYGNTTVKNEDGLEWSITNSVIEKECYSANQAEELIEVNQTKIIEIFNNVGDTVFTVNFDKQPTHKDYLALVRDEKGQFRSFEAMKKDFKDFRGENRTLIGYLITSETGFGRSRVIDLEVKEGSKFRQVDHRYINWLIVKNKKYIVK